MAENSKIEWTDHTFNPWEGCQKVGPGCDHCYAEARNARFGGGIAVNWGPGAARRLTSDSNWAKPLKWNVEAARLGVRYRVFCASLADVFDNAVDPAWRLRLFRLIARTPNLDWLLLTKRIGNARAMLDQVAGMAMGVPPCQEWQVPANIWLGATIVNQEEADCDIPKLLALPAAKRFLSMEPLLGPVDLQQHMWKCCGCPTPGSPGDGYFQPPDPPECCGNPEPSGLDWVIVGGESGHGARPMHPEWARDLRDQCASVGIPFLFKQWGEWTPGENVDRVRGTVDTAFLFNNVWRIYPLNLAIDGGHIDDEPDLYRVGKKAAGRHLDGITHDGFPT